MIDKNKIKQFVIDWLLPPKILRTIDFMIGWRNVPWRLSREDKALIAENIVLKDRHRGQRCFVMGSGSSIKRQDLKKLVGEYVISVSNTFVHPDYHLFRPKYHVLPSILSYHPHVTSEEHFVRWLVEMEKETFDAEMFFHIGDRKMIESNGLFRNRTIYWNSYRSWYGNPKTEIDLTKRIPHVNSVSEYAITVALYLGFDKIYLIGFDHDWYKGLGVYFYNKQTEHVIPLQKEKMKYLDMEQQMRRHAEIFKKYKYLYGIRKNIYNANANPNHYLDVFPKVDFDSLFSAPRK